MALGESSAKKAHHAIVARKSEASPTGDEHIGRDLLAMNTLDEISTPQPVGDEHIGRDLLAMKALKWSCILVNVA